jgi:hypothetical protein
MSIRRIQEFQLLSKYHGAVRYCANSGRSRLLTGRRCAGIHDINVQTNDNGRVSDTLFYSSNNLWHAKVIDIEGVN